MTDAKPPSPFRLALLVAAVGAVAQVIYFLCAPVIVSNDSVGYIRAALGLIESGSFSDLEAVRTPGYPIFIAAIFCLSGKSIAAVALAQHLLLAMLAGLVCGTFQRRFGATLSAGCGLLICLDPFLGLYAQWIISETPFCFALTAALLAALNAETRPRAWGFSGLLFGAAALIRPNGLVAAACTAGLLVLICTLAKPSRKAYVKALAAFSAGLLVATIPWCIHRLAISGEIGLAKSETAFLRVQMLQHQMMFDPNLLEDEELRSYYFELKQEREKHTTEQKHFRRGFAFVFREHLQQSLSERQIDDFYNDYLEHYMKSHAREYFTQALNTLLNLLHLKNDYPSSLNPAHRYLLGEVPLLQQVRSITATNDEFELLYQPKKLNALSTLWANVLIYLSSYMPLGGIIFTGFCIITIASQAVRRTICLLDTLALLIFFTQAAAYAYLLHTDDRYTLVLNPILYIQCALFIRYWVQRKSEQS
ncbi:MAG: glycosyltransferase family 39 protein [Bdellovibrionales bacterium]|nr:glycosyltransferase family 39 protein [Bdellovibrionales bacterium]